MSGETLGNVDRAMLPACATDGYRQIAPVAAFILGNARLDELRDVIDQAPGILLGFEEPQGWSKRSVERTAPFALLLYSLIVVWFARVGHRLYTPPVRPWYRTKARPSFADMLRTLRQASIGEWVSANVPEAPPVRKLVEALSVAALAGP